MAVPFEAETGTDSCRVMLEGGSLGGYRSDIITEILSEREKTMLNCPRCIGIMKDASITNTGEQLCVCCKREDEQIRPHAEFLRNTIQSLKCACPLSTRGCEWLGRLGGVENHLTTCGHVYALCELKCGAVTTRIEMRWHTEKECPQREEACLHCSGVHKASEMGDHVKVCGKVEVECELGCGTRMCREGVLCHRERECLEATVVCPYQKYRCEVVGMKKRELKQHLEENRCLHTELKLKATEEKFVVALENNASLSEICDKMMLKVDSLEENIATLRTEMKRKDSRMEMLMKQVAEKQGSIDSLENNIEKFSRDNQRLKKQMSELESKVRIRENDMKLLNERYPAMPESKFKWIIEDFRWKYSPKLKWFYSQHYEIAGYRFQLTHCTDFDDFIIDFDPRTGDNYESLEWPFRASFTTRVICHRNQEDSLTFRNTGVVIPKSEFGSYGANKRIATISLSKDLIGFLKSGSLEVEFAVRINRSF